MRKNDLMGRRFGRLEILRAAEQRLNGGIAWHCLCECGNQKIIRAHSLLKQLKPTRSCGCITKEVVGITNTTHGYSYGTTYRTWAAMVTRCYNKNDKDYKNYGGRGIVMCEAVRNSVAAIIDVIGERPSGRTIDRIDNNAGYWCGACADCVQNSRPLNMRWATLREQGCNQRTNHRVEINGVTHAAVEWARLAGLKPGTVIARLRRGWTGEKLLTPLPQ